MHCTAVDNGEILWALSVAPPCCCGEHNKSNPKHSLTMSQRKSKLLFADSKLTEEERRAIRADLRKVKHDLSHGHSSPTKAREINNVLNEKVCYTRESVLDAENVGLIATVYGKEMEKAVKVSD